MQLSDNETRQLRTLLAKQQMDDANTAFAYTWIQHPTKVSWSVMGDMPRLVQISSQKRYAEMIGEGWTPASPEIIKKYEELSEIPGNVMKEEVNRRKEKIAEGAILRYYSTIEEDDVPDKWQEKLDKLKVRTESKPKRGRPKSGTGDTANAS